MSVVPVKFLRRFRIKQGDLFPSLEHQAKNHKVRTATDVVGPTILSGANLTGATAVVFVFRLVGALPATAVTQTAVFVNRATGELRYDWQAGDTDVEGKYYGEFIVTFPTGERTLPVDDPPIRFTVTKDLDT